VAIMVPSGWEGADVGDPTSRSYSRVLAYGADVGELEALRRGGEVAFRALVERHQASLTRVARSLLRDPSLARASRARDVAGGHRGRLRVQGAFDGENLALRYLHQLGSATRPPHAAVRLAGRRGRGVAGSPHGRMPGGEGILRTADVRSAAAASERAAPLLPRRAGGVSGGPIVECIGMIRRDAPSTDPKRAASK
jgi:hypothetical protein